MKIGLVGSSGYISGFIIDRFKDKNQIIRIDKNDEADYYLDLENASAFDYDILNDLEYVIFPAAISGPDMCDKQFEMCWEINVEGTSKFIEEALKRGNRVLFFSSDAVFGDDPDTVFDENSETKASTAYGRMKKAVEDRFKDNHNFKAIRLSYVVSAKDKFAKYVLNCLKNDEICEVYDPFNRNCITIGDVITCIDYLINNWDAYEPTFLNIAGKDLISREDIVKELNKIYDNRIRYKVMYPGDDFYKSRYKTTRMTSLYLKKYQILPEESFTEKIKREFHEKVG